MRQLLHDRSNFSVTTGKPAAVPTDRHLPREGWVAVPPLSPSLPQIEGGLTNEADKTVHASSRNSHGINKQLPREIIFLAALYALDYPREFVSREIRLDDETFRHQFETTKMKKII